jgi:Rnl2 family RNA ligase
MDGTVKYARREGILEPDEKLVKTTCGTWQELMQEMKHKFDEAIQIVRARYPDAEHITFFGELIGSSVYNRVHYGDKLSFYGFDIYIGSKPPVDKCGINDRYLDFDEMTDIYDTVGIFRAIIIRIGTLQNLLTIDPDFPSHIGAAICPAVTSNISEGVVIVPRVNCYTDKGERCILKHKSSKFADRKQPKVYNLQDKTLSEESEEAVQLLLQFNTQNRVIDTLSKMNPEDPRGKICYAVFQDILNSAKEECSIDLKVYPQKRDITAAVMREIQLIVPARE